MLDEVTKSRIDAMDYEQMLYLWRFAPIGDPMFQGEVGKYYGERMESIKPENHVEISKRVGWDR